MITYGNNNVGYIALSCKHLQIRGRCDEERWWGGGVVREREAFVSLHYCFC